MRRTFQNYVPKSKHSESILSISIFSIVLANNQIVLRKSYNPHKTNVWGKRCGRYRKHHTLRATNINLQRS